MMKKRIAAVLRRTATKLDPPREPQATIGNINISVRPGVKEAQRAIQYANDIARQQQAAIRETFNR